MKKILFLIIGTLLVLGLVLPGCGNGVADDFDQYIKIGIAGPMGQSQGKHHMYGAEMARDEINDAGAGGVTVGGLVYGIELVEIDTNEVLSPSGVDGLTAMSDALSDGVDIFMGGFRTEAVFAYRTVAVGPTGADKIFIDCGAATEALTHDVVDDYDNYKYWFKGTPPNELFLSESNSKLIGMIVAMTTGYKAAVTANASAEYAPKVAFIAEEALWTELSRALTTYKLGTDYGWLVGPTANHVWTPAPVATPTQMNTMLNEIAGYNPEIILTIMSGPVGVTYASLVDTYMPDVLTLGINVEAQRVGFPEAVGEESAEGMIFLDSWAPGVNITTTTAAFLDAFEDKTEQWPIYTAATYDALLSLVESIVTANSLSAAALIPIMEASQYAGTSGTSAYYPLDDGSTTGNHPFGVPFGYPATTEALNVGQVLALYPWLTSAKYSNGMAVSNWTYSADDWTMLPHTSHDLVYGPEWVTGTASQWQDVSGNLTKVGVWPKPYLAGAPYNFPTSQAMWLGYLAGAPDAVAVYTAQELGLWDKYGWWHFEYEGTGTVDLTDWWTWLALGW